MSDEKLGASPELTKRFKEGIDKRLTTLIEAKDNYRNLHSRLAIILIVIAAFNTAIVAFSQSDKAWSGWGPVAVVASTLLAILSGVNGFLRPQERFVRNARALNQVLDVKDRFEWRSLQEPGLTMPELNSLYGEFREIEKTFFEDLATLVGSGK